MPQLKILCIVTGGPADQPRARRLMAKLQAAVTYVDIDRSRPRWESSKQVWEALKSDHWDLVYLEGTGTTGGLNVIRAALLRKQVFIVSSGDPIGGFFRATRGPLWGWLMGAYERLLYRTCAGFVGWTPYLTGMALAHGAPRGVTVEGGVDLELFRPLSETDRLAARRFYGLDPSHLVCGVVGTLNWSERASYGYGVELIEALNRVHRTDCSVLIVGDGPGRARLEQRVHGPLRDRVRFTGRLPREEVARAINAMDVAFNTQTIDGLGLYRLTAKLPEYLACGVPVAMSPVPGFFDYVREAGWALPALHPASSAFAAQVAVWINQLTRDEIASKAARAREVAGLRFDYEPLSDRFAAFVQELLEQSGTASEAHCEERIRELNLAVRETSETVRV